MAYRGTLHIYNGDEFGPLKTANENRAIAGHESLLPVLDKERSLGNTYSHLIFTAHGTSGSFDLGTSTIDYANAHTPLSGYSVLFPAGGTVYVRGCNCGEGDMGLRLMKMLGVQFLWSAGGLVIAHVTKGIYVDDTVATIFSIATGQGVFELLNNRAVFGDGTKRVVTMTGGGGYLGWSSGPVTGTVSAS